VGRGHVVSVGAFTDAQEQHRPGTGAIRSLQEREPGTLTDRDSVALGIERPAGVARSQAQGLEAVQGHEAQRVGASNDGGVAHSGSDHARGVAEDLGR